MRNTHHGSIQHLTALPNACIRLLQEGTTTRRRVAVLPQQQQQKRLHFLYHRNIAPHHSNVIRGILLSHLLSDKSQLTQKQSLRNG
mmetsp:Transcript_6794/g.25351  ORF Transcript_6794/g.25351 Transcript_6794/m.25351 type:complete len:86 (+) Transcript_6794:267-524(+)